MLLWLTRRKVSCGDYRQGKRVTIMWVFVRVCIWVRGEAREKWGSVWGEGAVYGVSPSYPMSSVLLAMALDIGFAAPATLLLVCFGSTPLLLLLTPLSLQLTRPPLLSLSFTARAGYVSLSLSSSLSQLNIRFFPFSCHLNYYWTP